MDKKADKKPIRNDIYHGLLKLRTPVTHAVDSYNWFVNHDLENICKRSGYFKSSRSKTYLAFKGVRVVRPADCTLKSCIFNSKNYFANVIADFYVVEFYNNNGNSNVANVNVNKSTTTKKCNNNNNDVPNLPPCFSNDFINSNRYPLIKTDLYESKVIDVITDVELFQVPIYTRSILCESTSPTTENKIPYNGNFVYDENAKQPPPYICESDPGGGFYVGGRERVLVNQMQNRLGEVLLQSSKEKGFASVAEVRFGCPVRDAYVLICAKMDHNGQIYVSLPSVKCSA